MPSICPRWPRGWGQPESAARSSRSSPGHPGCLTSTQQPEESPESLAGGTAQVFANVVRP